jgi:transcriptional regulator with XRE-family HTH domain
MRLSNGLFAHAIDWIYANTDVKDQKTLAALTKITETTISRILNDRVNKPSEDTILKLNNAFGGIFNLSYFRGESTYLLMQDVMDARMQKASIPSQDEPTANIIELYASLIKDIEGIRQQLKQELAEVQAIKQEYMQARDDFRKVVAALHPSIKYTKPSEPTLMAAENTPEK